LFSYFFEFCFSILLFFDVSRYGFFAFERTRNRDAAGLSRLGCERPRRACAIDIVKIHVSNNLGRVETCLSA
jgi:hypothetical protein